MFITFEGADGSGKSTQVELAKKYLSEKGYDVYATRDPGGTELGLQFRQILLHYEGDLSSVAETFIFLADRAQHVETKIKPLLAEGKIVLCDRFIDSTVAYQGYGRGIAVEEIEKMNFIATQQLMPYKTFLFDISYETSMQRVAKGGKMDRLESEMADFHHRLINGYREIASKNPDRFIIISAENSVEQVAQDVAKELDNLLAK